jgi:ATP-dependent Lon protease
MPVTGRAASSRSAARHNTARPGRAWGRGISFGPLTLSLSATAGPVTVARVQVIDDPAETDPEIEGRGRALRQRAIEILQLLPQVPEEMVSALQGVEGAGRLADFIAGLMDVGVEEKQALLETFDLKARLDKLHELLARRIEVLKVSREVDERTRESISDVNRKHLLREQMRTIQKELGEG